MTNENTNGQSHPSGAEGPRAHGASRRGEYDETLVQVMLIPLGIFLIYLSVVVGLLSLGQGALATLSLAMGIAFLVAHAVLKPEGLAGIYSRTFHWSRGYSLNNLILILAIAGILVLVNFYAYRHSTKIDYTQQQLFSLSDQTKSVLANLKDRVTVTAFYPDYRGSSQEAQLFMQFRKRVKDLLDDYERYSRDHMLKVDLVDPLKNPVAAKQYGLGDGDWGTVFFETGGRKVKVAREKLFARPNPFMMGPTAFKGEEAFTGALLELTSGTHLTVYFLEGHGEKQVDTDQPQGYSSLKTYLERERYTIKQLALYKSEKVPDDCNVLVVAGPTKPFAPAEIEKIRKYLETPGKGAFFLLDPKPVAGLKQMLADFGIDWTENVMIEPDPRLALEGSPIALLTAPKQHAITSEILKGRLPVLVYEGTHLNKLAKPADRFDFAEILSSIGTQGWAEFDMASIKAGRVEMNQGVDRPGPLTLGWAVEVKHGPPSAPKTDDPSNPDKDKKDDSPKSRLVVIGDSDFPSDFVRSLFPIGANADLFMNSVGWLSFSSEKTATIRPKDEAAATVSLTNEDRVRVGRFCIIIFPLTVLMIGIMVWIRRSSL